MPSTHRRGLVVFAILTLVVAVWGCRRDAGGDGAAPAASPGAAAARSLAPDSAGDEAREAARARAFLDWVDAELARRLAAAGRADWAFSMASTSLNEGRARMANERLMAFIAEARAEAARYEGVALEGTHGRMLERLRVYAEPPPAPAAREAREALAGALARLDALYTQNMACDERGACQGLARLEETLAETRDPAVALAVWRGWRAQTVAMREPYERFVALANQGAREAGYADLGELWRSGYDMTPQAFEAEVERLWTQVAPLYEQLHCYTRARLSARYGPQVVPPDGLIPAHLLGNMWAQDWTHVHDLLEPYPAQASPDVTAALVAGGYDAARMVRLGEAFFTSLGLDPLPQSFWERSMLERPEGDELVCHPSAWDVNHDGDLRLMMCVRVNHEDLITIHHELGHCYYYHYYHALPALLQDGAHDGFHEAIGDAIALSVTPDYLQRVGLIEAAPRDAEGLINVQLQRALGLVAFLPFGKLVDQWRWGVFAGTITPDTYNAAWWALRERYQGVGPPQPRPEAGLFDPGAKHHIASNVPYVRYFLAAILQFQLHAALCEAAGHEGPLHACSIHGSAAAGERLRSLLALGASAPWPDALEAIAGTRQMDAGPMLEYFAPLRAWLQTQNAGRACGW